MISYCGISTDKAEITNLGTASNRYLGGNETVLANLRMVSNVIAGPKYRVFSNRYRWLYNVLFENEGMLS